MVQVCAARWWWERMTRPTLPLLLLLLLVAALYLASPALHPAHRPRPHPITLVMSAGQLRAMMASKAGPTPLLPTDMDFAPQELHRKGSAPQDLHHKGYAPQELHHKDSSANLKSQENTVGETHRLWPLVLQHSEAKGLLEVLEHGHYDPEERRWLEGRLEEMVARARTVRRACQDHSVSPTNTHLVWDTLHTPNIVWCPNYKVASTTWMVNFLKLAHFNDDNPAIPDVPAPEKEILKYSVKYGARHGVVSDLYPTPATDHEKAAVMKQSVRVIIVRHPFTRILSAYRDKMLKEHPMPPKFGFKKMQKEIISRYRASHASQRSPYPTFSEFVQYIIDFTANFTTANQWRTNVRCWTPYWVQCGVCSSDYNIIMKLETMAEDERFLITLANLEELKSGSEWRHLQNVSSHQAAPHFYNQLTRRQMINLYHRYQLDFALFNYSIDDYLSLAKDNPTVHHDTPLMTTSL